MKRNPIKPVTELFQFELNRDSEIWQEILDKEQEIDGLKITLYNYYKVTGCSSKSCALGSAGASRNAKLVVLLVLF